MQRQCVIFDMDGVLVDSGPWHLKAWQVFANKYGLTFDEAHYFSTFGMRNDEIIPKLFPKQFNPKDFYALNEEKEAFYRDLIRGKIVPPAGLMAFVADLRQQGIRMAVGSSGTRPNVLLVLEALRLTDLISAYVCGDDVKRGKPAPDVFLLAAQKMGVAPQFCVVIEDAVMGIKAAKTAGMQCVAITTTTTREHLHEADMIVDSFTELSAQTVRDLL
ncbi:MAG: glycoprotease family protein/hydrolase, beta-phosphoglucomutase family [uncultured bacterium]|nr:MAG: glycoprotease family protein/hydrolase, beta-phosphoglucomutase family [uncultured bacterium]HLD44309.1 HAD family phosphatase [bacterium]